MYSSFCGDFTGKHTNGDTTLKLNAFGYGQHETATNNLDDGCKLVLGLGPTPSAYSDEYSTSRANKAKELTNMINQGLSSQRDSILKLGLSGSIDAVSNVLNSDKSLPIVDEGSTSAKTSGGYMRKLIMAPQIPEISLISEPSAVINYSMSAITEPVSATVSSDNKPKRCNFPGCTKGARGSSRLCIGHGGGQRCQKPGCDKGAETRTIYCKTHGGGKRCQHLGCTKSAEGKTDNCIAHGGGKRCGHIEGCTKAARGKSGLCIRHGGGKRCKVDKCTRSAEGEIGLCISHGGGRRCQFTGCVKGAQGSTVFCKAHGGGKRCIFSGCNKGAEGSTPLCKGHGGGKRCLFDGGGICPKSVHGGTNFCVAHGGGKRCAVLGCSKSARGRTDCCVKHGGGKRCRFEKCDKSAQGSTDFCKAHGGGKRCSWNEGECVKFARGKGGLCAAHMTVVYGHRECKKVGSIGPGLFHGLVVHGKNSKFDNTSSSSGVSVVSDSIGELERSAKRQQLIPAQVLVPLSMKGSCKNTSGLDLEKQVESEKGFEFEGRVHGGGLMSFLGGDLRNGLRGVGTGSTTTFEL